MYKSFLIKYAEIAIKGKNRYRCNHPVQLLRGDNGRRD